VFHLIRKVNCHYIVKYRSPIAISNGQKLGSTWGSSSVLNTICINLAHVVSRQTVVAAVRFRSQASPCGICGGQSGLGTGVCPSPSVFALSLSIHQCPILIWLPFGREKNRVKPGDLPKKVKILEIMDPQGEKIIPQFTFGLPSKGWLSAISGLKNFWRADIHIFW